jgi:PAS domain S-box-containing protein
MALPNGDGSLQRDRYRVFIEDAADGLFETDLQGNFTFFNQALCRIFGYDRAALHQRNFRDFMDAENARIAYKSFNRIYRTGKKIHSIQWKIISKDGDSKILDISGNLVYTPEGDKAGFRGIARDITDKHLAEKALRESEECNLNLYKVTRRAERRYRAFLEFLPYPVFVFNLDSTVSYINPAFEEVFGWTFEEMEGKRIPFVPDSLLEETRQGLRRLFREKVVHGYETRRLTRDGRVLDIVLDGAIFFDEDSRPAGQVVTFRDVTHEKRAARNTQALFRIASALHRFRRLDERLEYITREVQELVGAGGASVILLDEKKKEFFFRVAAYENSETVQKMKEIRFPLTEGVAGQVYRTGEPLIVHDTSKSPYFFNRVDEQSEYRTENMLDVPVRNQDRMIGVLCAVNKKEGAFDATDVALMSAIGNMIALPVENARINEALKRSYEEVQSLNRAKGRVIHHLSHELKTPVSVLSASLGLLQKRMAATGDQKLDKIFERSQRNLDRILDMQYQIEDIMRDRQYRTFHMLSLLLDACTDELETLAEEVCGNESCADRIRSRIEEIFGPRESTPKPIALHRFVAERADSLRPKFAHRDCRLALNIAPARDILIPPDVLSKVVDGLIRNAVENTPEGGVIKVTVAESQDGPELVVADTGVGITPENQALIFENYFTTYETMQYSSRRPFDFAAGGKGFDLLRMKIFSERYHFTIRIESRRCAFLSDAASPCPGSVTRCENCRKPADCAESGGTVVRVIFPPVGVPLPGADNPNLRES